MLAVEHVPFLSRKWRSVEQERREGRERSGLAPGGGGEAVRRVEVVPRLLVVEVVATEVSQREDVALGRGRVHVLPVLFHVVSVEKTAAALVDGFLGSPRSKLRMTARIGAPGNGLVGQKGQRVARLAVSRSPRQ